MRRLHLSSLYVGHVCIIKRPRSFHDLDTELDLHLFMSGFHVAFATGVACQQGALPLPDPWFRPPFCDLLVLQPDSSNLPCFTRLSPWIPLGTFSIFLDILEVSYNLEMCFPFKQLKHSLCNFSNSYLASKLIDLNLWHNTQPVPEQQTHSFCSGVTTSVFFVVDFDLHLTFFVTTMWLVCHFWLTFPNEVKVVSRICNPNFLINRFR